MSRITIYATPYCGYCHRAKALLKSKGLEFDEIDVSYDPSERQRMTVRAKGRRTVPQIFFGETHIGGSEELYALDREGKLDSMLAAA